MRKFEAPADTGGITTSIGNHYAVVDGHIEVDDDVSDPDLDSLRQAGFVEILDAGAKQARPATDQSAADTDSNEKPPKK